MLRGKYLRASHGKLSIFNRVMGLVGALHLCFCYCHDDKALPRLRLSSTLCCAGWRWGAASLWSWNLFSDAAFWPKGEDRFGPAVGCMLSGWPSTSGGGPPS